MKQTITITREISDIVIPGKRPEAKLSLDVDPPSIHPFEVGIMFAAALQFYMARMVEVENQNLIKMQQEHPELFNPVPVPEPPVS